MSDLWWEKLGTHFRLSNGFPLPTVMRAQAERELLRLCPGTLDKAIDTVIADSALSQSLVDSLGMGLTWFNRESRGIAGLVAAFRTQLRSSGRTTSWVWSAGCSMGHEPYSIAIALLEAGAQPIILATDLNREHLRIADAGQYRRAKLDTVLPSLLQKYFKVQPNGMYGVNAQLRDCITFEHHNFATAGRPPAGWSNFDAVVCRNALIYYDADEGARIARSLSRSIRPQGALLVGAVERPLVHKLQLGSVAPSGLVTLSYKPDAKPIAAAPIASASKAPSASPVREAPTLRKSAPSDGSDLTLEALLHEADRLTRQGDQAEACIELLSEALVRFPLAAAVHLLLGLAMKRCGRDEEALTPLRAARFLDSSSWLPVYHLAMSLETAGLREEAQLAFRDTLALIRSGSVCSSTDLPGVGDLHALASTVAEHCTQRLSFES